MCPAASAPASLLYSSGCQLNFQAAGPITTAASVTLGQMTISAPSSRAFLIPQHPRYALAERVAMF